jgi:dolichol-phosphate mannosyltransferase
LDHCNGEVIVIMDADLQDPPEVIPEMIKKWKEGYDVVYGRRENRDADSKTKRFFAYSFYRVINWITGISIPPDTGDFRLMDSRAVDAFRQLRERQRFVRGMVTWIGFQQAPVCYDRPARAAGETKYPFRKSLLLAIDAITSFSYAPLRLASWLGFGLSVFAFVYILVVIGLKIAGINFPGYTSLMGAILLLGGVQLIVLGVIGEYLGRIYEEVKRRPLYYVDKRLGDSLESKQPQVSNS